MIYVAPSPTRSRDVAGGRITGIRGWICPTSSLGSPVIIVQVRSHAPDPGSFQFSQSPAKVNGRPSFMAIANGSFGLVGFRDSENPSAGIKQRRFAKARRKEGALSTVSARALMVR